MDIAYFSMVVCLSCCTIKHHRSLVPSEERTCNQLIRVETNEFCLSFSILHIFLQEDDNLVCGIFSLEISNADFLGKL